MNMNIEILKFQSGEKVLYQNGLYPNMDKHIEEVRECFNNNCKEVKEEKYYYKDENRYIIKISGIKL